MPSILLNPEPPKQSGRAKYVVGAIVVIAIIVVAAALL